MDTRGQPARVRLVLYLIVFGFFLIGIAHHLQFEFTAVTLSLYRARGRSMAIREK